MKRERTTALLAAVLSTLLAGTASATTFTTINDPAAPTSGEGTVPRGVSGNNVVGLYFDASGEQNGFEYNTATNTWTSLQDPLAGPVSQDGGTLPIGISGNNIVGTFSDTSGNEHGFLYNGTNWTSLDDPSSNNPAGGTLATGISGNYVVGYYYTNGASNHGFLYNMTTHAWTTLDGPSPSGSATGFAWGISGNYVVGDFTDPSSGNEGGYLYSINTQAWTKLQDPLDSNFSVMGISGNYVVGVNNILIGSKHATEAFLYNIATNTWTAFQDPLADLTVSVNSGTTALGVDGDEIVGRYGAVGSTGGAQFVGYEAVVPEPPSIILLAFGGTALGGFLVRRRKLKVSSL